MCGKWSPDVPSSYDSSIVAAGRDQAWMPLMVEASQASGRDRNHYPSPIRVPRSCLSHWSHTHWDIIDPCPSIGLEPLSPFVSPHCSQFRWPLDVLGPYSPTRRSSVLLNDAKPGNATGTQADVELGTECERDCVSSCVSPCVSRRRRGAFPRGAVPSCVLLTVITLGDQTNTME